MIHFACLCTNRYRDLGIRLERLFHERMKFDWQFHAFTESPAGFRGPRFSFHERKHANWLSAIRDRFNCLLSLDVPEDDYVYLIDADTNVLKDIHADEILGDVVACQHFGDSTWLRNAKGEMVNGDTNPKSSCYLPPKKDATWYMGCFHGGKWSHVRPMYQWCNTAMEKNLLLGHEPGVNDESYLNRYLYDNPPTRVLKWPTEFPFLVSDKGGASCLRT